MNLTLSQIAVVLGAELIGEDRHFSQISINTRTIEAGDLFVAIKGENFDAHDYINQAEEKGACGLVVEKNNKSLLPQIQVKDTRVALGHIASLWSSAFSLPIVAITGSCGKTTVKEMTAAILGHSYKRKNKEDNEHILATKGNLNNDIGVPMTLLRLTADHKAAVIELGANHIGEIRQLVDMVQPDVALITNVAPAHIEGFGSIEGVAEAKSEIYEGLEHDGTAIINIDDQFADFWQEKCQRLKEQAYQTAKEQNQEHEQLKIVTFGLDKAADFSAEYEQKNDAIELILSTPVGKKAVRLNQLGRHNVYNALAATAAAISSGCSLDDVKSGLEGFQNVAGRLEKKSGINGSVLFDDTYNANPGSVKAGIEAIQQVTGESLLILGDMGELGDESRTLHYQLGEDAARMGIEQLFTVGSLSEETTRGFNSVADKMGNAEVKALHFNNKDSLVEHVKNKLNNRVVVLVKGSRTMGMESVVAALVDKTSEKVLDTDSHFSKQKKTEGAQ
jgi:UDP-N-acetylmuramoyl-tripeptide--D-alanyl-D-alanine ligase